MEKVAHVLVYGCFNGRLGHYGYGPGWKDIPRELSRHLEIYADHINGMVLVEAGILGQNEGAWFERRWPEYGGWSFITWWDRQGDRRPGSHTTLIVQGLEHTPAQIFRLAREQVPWAFRVPIINEPQE